MDKHRVLIYQEIIERLKTEELEAVLHMIEVELRERINEGEDEEV